MPCTKLPARLSRLCLASWFRFGLFIDIGFAPAKESCRDLPIPILESKAVPLIMADVRVSLSRKFVVVFFVPCDEGDEDEFRVGVAISIGVVIGMLYGSLSKSGVKGWSDAGEEELESCSSSLSSVGAATLATGESQSTSTDPIVITIPGSAFLRCVVSRGQNKTIILHNTRMKGKMSCEKIHSGRLARNLKFLDVWEHWLWCVGV